MQEILPQVLLVLQQSAVAVLLGITEEKRRKKLRQNEIRFKNTVFEKIFQSKDNRESQKSSKKSSHPRLWKERYGLVKEP